MKLLIAQNEANENFLIKTKNKSSVNNDSQYSYLDSPIFENMP